MKNKRTVKKNLLLKNLKNDIYCRLAPSKIHNVGVFAIREIPKNYNPFKLTYELDDCLVRQKELENIPEAVKKIIKDFHVFENGRARLLMSGPNAFEISFYINHSANPNLYTKDEGVTFYTKRKIKAGEELTANYFTYDQEDQTVYKE